MRDTDPNMAALGADDRRQVEQWLLRFDQSWHEGRLEEALTALPPPGSPLRRPMLVEMVKIDIDRQWQRGHKHQVEDYLRELPELGSADTAPPDLLQAEYFARQDAGDTADLIQFGQRFPKQAEALRQLVQRSVSAVVRDSRATPLPAGVGKSSQPHLPEQFGRYQVLRRLGQGGMGTVYLARDTELDRQVALKVPNFTAESKEVVERFYREARAAAGLSHPNICAIYDVGQINGISYLTMAYVEGKTLNTLIRPQKPLNQMTAAALLRKIALALEEAHGQGIVHRDLKPANVMINVRKEPVIMDFGLARRMLSDDTRLTRSGAVVGTPAYMAPEQVNGVDAGAASDIYSLGVILYELLTGKVPFEGPALALLGQILTQPPEPPSQHRPDLDPALEKICLRALAKDPAARFASAKAFADALDGAIKAATSMKAHPPTSGPADLSSPRPTPSGQTPSGAGRSRRRWWIAAAAMSAAALLVWLGVTLYHNTGEGTVVIKLSDPAASVDVKLNGRQIDIAVAGEEHKITAGKHELQVVGPGYETVTKSFRIKRGDRELVEVELKTTPAAAAGAVTPKASSQKAALQKGFTMTVIAKTTLSKRAGGDDRLAIFIMLNQDPRYVYRLDRPRAFRPGSVDRFDLAFELPLKEVRDATLFVKGTNAWHCRSISFQFSQGDEQSPVYEFDVNRNLSTDKGDKNALRSRRFDLSPRLGPAPPSDAKQNAAKLSWFGYHLLAAPKSAEEMRELASYTNVVFDQTWTTGNDSAVAQASAAGLKAVLCFAADHPSDDTKIAALRILSKYGDTIVAVCAIAAHLKAQDIKQFTAQSTNIKKVWPDVQFWVMVTDDKLPTGLPVEIDGLAVALKDAIAPEAVQARADRYVPGWKKIAAQRPVLLVWLGFDGSGGMPDFQANTIRRGAEAAQAHGLRGFVVASYGAVMKSKVGAVPPGLESQPALVAEMRAVAGELGIASPAKD